MLLVSLYLELTEELVKVMDFIVGQILQILIRKLLLNTRALALDKEQEWQLEQLNHKDSSTPDSLRSILPVLEIAEERRWYPDEQIRQRGCLIESNPIPEIFRLLGRA